MEKLRLKIVQFIESPKDVPLLAGFVIGVYMLLYYYAQNISVANSWIQFAFFTAYYVVVPTFVLFAGYTIFAKIKGGRFKRHFLFVAIPVLLSFYLLQLSWLGEYKRYIFGCIIIIMLLLSTKLARYYKVFVVLIPFMTLFNLAPLVETAVIVLNADDAWQKQQDDIENIVFKQKPNIYYLQPDGYASFENLKKPPYSFDDSSFEGYLKDGGFTLYENYRSNYFSTLLSNSSAFSMKHHYAGAELELTARDIIMGDNPVLRILKRNGYTTHFISDKPYLVINRPGLGYDHTNFKYAELPFIKDGWDAARNQDIDFIKSFETNLKKGGNFYFLEKMDPSHITTFKEYSKGAAKERELYIERLENSKNWLKRVVGKIQKHDPLAVIIIAADHGGFVGFDYTLQAEYKTNNPALIKSIFGAMAAIKWNNPSFNEYDGGLYTSVNLFRTVFAFLAQDKKYLDNLQEDASYINLLKPEGVYRIIDTKGNVVFQKK